MKSETEGSHSRTQDQAAGDCHRILVLGVGNLLMGDEGVGVHAARRLEQEQLPAGATVVDGGTGGFHLLSYLQEYSTVIMIDACMDGQAAGTVSIIKPRFATDFPKALSAHDIGLKDLIESATLLGSLPETHLITISIAEIQPMVMELSPAVAASLPDVASKVREILLAETLAC
ncbi:MAG: HyaD/HybD family hydrogenase maturation endopeptidase [Acidobacteriota bacterium]